MSEVIIIQCEFTREVNQAASEACKKAAADWKSPLAAAYAQVSLELRRILERHASKCAICLKEDGIFNAVTNLSHRSTAVAQ